MDNKNYRLTCVIVNFNDYKTTSELVSKISKYELFYKIIIVDNNSTNNSFFELEKLSNDKIKVIKSGKNGGYGFGNNYGVRYSYEEYKNEYTLIANPDVDFDEELVLKLLSSIVKNNATVTSAKRVTIDGKIQHPNHWRLPNSWNYSFESFMLISKLKNRKGKYKNDKIMYEQNVDCVAGSLLLLNTLDFISVGGYDENMFLYGEETLLGYKLAKNNMKTIILDEYYFHYHSKTISKFLNLRKQQKQINKSKKYIINNYFSRKKITNLMVNALFVFVEIENFILTTIITIFRRRKM